MAQEFPAPYRQLESQNQFSGLEVGLVHPNANSFVRLHNNADVELHANDGLGIMMHAPNRTMTFIADQIKFITKDDGLRWNSLSFNKDAYQYQQPTFFQIVDDNTKSLYRGVHVFTHTVDERNDVAVSNE